MTPRRAPYHVMGHAVFYADEVILTQQPVPGSQPIRPLVLIRRPDGSWRLVANTQLAPPVRPAVQLNGPVVYLGATLQQ